GAKIDPADREWAETHFLPLLGTPGVEYLGEVDEQQKAELLGGAIALLFPIDWPEPFGLVLAEAMACGTPVIAFPGGAVEEIVVDGLTGFLCRSRTLDEMVAAVQRVDQLDRAACRRHVERHFSSVTMTDAYEAIYRQVVFGQAVPLVARSDSAATAVMVDQQRIVAGAISRRR
ncbi:MAG: glycosyltransferase, partial [Thermomicrobium sp.]|nr:glycosyltransferase [Thermomicrobium sp.]